VSVRQRALPAWRSIDATWEEIVARIELGDAIILTLRFVPPAWLIAEVDADAGSIARTNHAVLAVGITEPSDRQQAVIVKNSWGPAWGDGGYGFVSRRYFEYFIIRVHAMES
jgi:hypothetical protein